jgi:predicted dehydrogenase
LINRILIVGLGSIGLRHLQLARQFFPEAEIKVLRHQQTDSVPEFADGYVSTISEALKFLPQVAVIANPATFHLQTAQALAETGVHLLIEKPLSHSIDKVEDLIKVSTTKKIVIQVGYNLRFYQSLKVFRKFILDGIVGEILFVNCEVGQYLPSWRPNSDYRIGVSAQKKLGGGVLLELSHEIDYINWIFGNVETVSSMFGKQSSLEIDVEDVGFLTLICASERFRKKILVNLSMDFIRQDPIRICTAVGENGTICWNGITGVVTLFKKGSSSWETIFEIKSDRNESYIAEWKNFLNAIKGVEKSEVTIIDAYNVLEIVTAARESNLLGHRVNTKLLNAKV